MCVCVCVCVCERESERERERERERKKVEEITIKYSLDPCTVQRLMWYCTVHKWTATLF
jgi:hypothetical protein